MKISNTENLDITNEIKEIENEIVKRLSLETNQFTKESSLIIRNQINSYLRLLDKLYSDINLQVIKAKKISKSIGANEEYMNYQIFKSLSYNQSAVNTLLTSGYSLIDQIRTFFTGEKITYTVGVEYYGTLYEFPMTMDQILSYSKATYNTRAKVENAFKLRLSARKKDLVDLAQRHEQKLMSSMKDVSSVYSAVRKYTGVKKLNQGNIYEAYRVYTQRYGFKVPPSFRTKQFDKILTEVQSNTASFVQGGDIGEEQIKFFGRSAPSLASTQTIRETLQIAKFLFHQLGTQGSDINQVKNTIINTFTKGQELDKATKKEIQKHLNEILQNFQIS